MRASSPISLFAALIALTLTLTDKTLAGETQGGATHGFPRFGISNENRESQTDSSRNRFPYLWLSGGLGAYRIADKYMGMVAGESISYQNSYQMITGRFLFYFDGILAGGSYDGSIWDVGLLYGLVTRSRTAMASLTAGPALTSVKITRGTSGNEYDVKTNKRSEFGLAIEAQMSAIISRYVAIGIHLYGNLNRVEHFYGVLFGPQIGNLR